jgi:DNA replication initiation complex subunit (GINS family)
MGDEESIPITYETLFEFLRIEKSREELQKLDDGFYNHVIQYLKQKQDMLDKKRHESDLFAAEEIKKIQIQIDNVHRILKDLHTKREKKILNLAWNKARTNSSLVTTQNLLQEEKQLFNNLSEQLLSFRSDVLLNILKLNLPTVTQMSSKVVPSASTSSPTSTMPSSSPTSTSPTSPSSDIPTQQTTSTSTISQNISDENKESTQIIQQEPTTNTSPNEDSVDDNNQNTMNNEEIDNEIQETKSVVFISFVPKFLGTNLETYGPYDKEDSAHLPTKIANVLVNKGRATFKN